MSNRLYIRQCKVYYTHRDEHEDKHMPRIPGKLLIDNKIQEMRTEANLTQQALADAVEITRATLLALEKGNYNPSLELAFRLASFFDTDITALFYERGAHRE